MSPFLILNLIGAGAGEHSADAAHASGGHGAEGGHVEIPNLITVLNTYVFKHGPLHDFLHAYENQIYFWLILILVAVGFSVACRRLAKVPGRGQAALELIFGGLYDFFGDIFGPRYARRFVPYVGTLFLFILAMNYAGLVPGFKSPTAHIWTTAALAVCTFAVVQYTGLTELGPRQFLMHYMQYPQGALGWALAPLFFVLHLIGELAKPLSLALRLFGNVTGEDILAGVVLVVFLSIGTIGWGEWQLGLPGHFLIFFLMLIFGTIQALIFSLLSAIYIFLFLPHEEHH